MSSLEQVYQYSYLDWDTNFFGISTGKITLNVTEETVDISEPLMRDLAKTTFTVISNIGNSKIANRIIGQHTSAFLVDMNIQFEKKADNKPKYFSDEIVIENNKNYSESLLAIAEQSFQYSRFFNDPFLNKEKAGKVYWNWVKSSFFKADKFFIEYKINQEVVGFLLYSVVDDIYTIELIAIKKAFSNQKLGTKLIEAFEYKAFKENNNAILRVGTQIDNKQAIHFYLKNNFHYIGCTSVYHHWKNKEEK